MQRAKRGVGYADPAVAATCGVSAIGEAVASAQPTCVENECEAYSFGAGVGPDDSGGDGCTPPIVLRP